MTTMTERPEQPVWEVRGLSDEDLRARTDELLMEAHRLSAQLFLQTERLNYAIELFSKVQGEKDANDVT